MNVDQIYQLQRDDAFARQFLSDRYSTFVAMPFSNRGGYPERRIRELLHGVAEAANTRLREHNVVTHRIFNDLLRVDEVTSGSVVITDEIIRQILNCHFFVGDLTGCNFGVVLETGIALALKPNSRVILFTQDDTASLHFDLRVTLIHRYDETNFVECLTAQLITAASSFETEADKYIRFITSQLTPEATVALCLYGILWKDHPNERPSLNTSTAQSLEMFRNDVGQTAFHNAVRELLDRRLLWTEYASNVAPGRDNYGMHATSLGWRVIERLWQHDPQMRQPARAPTGPNLG